MSTPNSRRVNEPPLYAPDLLGVKETSQMPNVNISPLSNRTIPGSSNSPRVSLRSRLTGAALALMLFAGSAPAQHVQGALRGQVTDELGGLIVGATVTLTGTAEAVRSVKTNQEGRYQFPALAQGRYVVSVEAEGFAPYQSAEVEVKPGARESLDIRLSVALGREEVIVTTGAALSTAAENNAAAIVLRTAEMEALPDDPDELAAALQALAGPGAGPDGGQIIVDSFDGGRVPPKNTIREIRINSNPFSAEYSRMGYGRIEILTKPGTDKFHGQAYFNFSHQTLNSRNPFADNRAPYRFALYGGNLTGPIVKKKSSFFLDFERRDINDNSVINATTLDESLNVKPFGLAVIVPQRRTTLSPRLDYQLSRDHTLVARYTYLRQGKQNEGVGNLSLPSRAYNTSGTEQTVQLTETALLNKQAVNEARFQYSRRESRQRDGGTAPSVNVLDAFNGGGAQVGDASAVEDRFELQNYTTFAMGRHTLKAGARLRYVRIESISPSNSGGTFTFAGGQAPLLDDNNQVVFERDARTGELAPVLTQISSIERYRRTLLFLRSGLTPEEIRIRGGGPTQFSVAAGDAGASVKQAELGLFVQDEWNPRPSLTLSAGLRYDVQGNVNRGFNLAPRVAFGYARRAANGGGAKTVVRGGFGVFFDRLGESTVLQAERFNAGGWQQFISTDPNVLGLFPSVPTPALLANSAAPPASVRIAPNLQLPYIMQGAVSVERHLPSKFVLTVTLLSARALHLLRSRNINAPRPGTFPAGPAGDGVRPSGDALGNIFQYESSGRLNQNQLIIGVNNPVSSKTSLAVTYILNKASSDVDGADTFPADSYDLSGEYGRSILDIRHRLDMRGVFSLKYGLSLNPFVLAASGAPFNITTGRDANADTLFMERPSFATDINHPGVLRTRFGLFNPSPRPGEQLIPRNYGASPAFFTVNLRVSKTWAFGEAAGASSARATGQAKQTAVKKGAAPAQAGGAVGTGTAPPNTNAGSYTGVSRSEKRFRMVFSVVARNILNHTNPGRPIGSLNSLLFGRSNFLAPPFGFGSAGETNAANRRVEAQLRFSF
jgi:hypothetical protein